MPTPILYSFRRCPYAMRARLAIAASGTTCAVREIKLQDKAAAFLAASPKGTVPVLHTNTGVIEESRDIMHWALAQNDPEGWRCEPAKGATLVDLIEGPFKTALDHTKYAVRFPDLDAAAERAKAAEILIKIDAQLTDQKWLYGPSPRLTDMAILPFVRQFANTDRTWFDAQSWPHLRRWLDAFTASERFATIMHKYPIWRPGDDETYFP